MRPFFHCQTEHWDAITRWLLEQDSPWPLEAAVLDLRFWTVSNGEIPSIATLQDRWAWGRDRTRELVLSDLWHDRTLPPPVRKGRISQGRHGRTPNMTQTSVTRKGR
jgi:hypothetical protein